MLSDDDIVLRQNGGFPSLLRARISEGYILVFHFQLQLYANIYTGSQRHTMKMYYFLFVLSVYSRN